MIVLHVLEDLWLIIDFDQVIVVEAANVVWYVPDSPPNAYSKRHRHMIIFLLTLGGHATAVCIGAVAEEGVCG